jgi:hypothetical protein
VLSFFVTSIGFGPKGALSVQLEAVQALPIGSIREDFDERGCPSKGENSGKAYTPGTDKTDKTPFCQFCFGIDKLPEPDLVEIEERKGMASNSVPELPRCLGDVSVAMSGRRDGTSLASGDR